MRANRCSLREKLHVPGQRFEHARDATDARRAMPLRLFRLSLNRCMTPFGDHVGDVLDFPARQGFERRT